MSDIENNEIETDLEVTQQVDEAADNSAANQATIAGNATVSRSDLLAKMVAYASKLDKESLAQAVETLTTSPDEVYASTQQATGDNSAKNKASIKSSGAPAEPMASVKEDLALLFGGSDDLSEDFRLKTEALFEAAVTTRVELERAKLEEAYEAQLEEEVTAVAEGMVESIDSYLNVAVAEWMNENKLALESGIRNELAESFLNGLHDLYTSHNVNINEENADIVESLAARVEELEAALSESVEVIESLAVEVNANEIAEVVDSMTESLSDVQKEKFVKLTEAIDFSDVEEFTKKAAIIKETYFNGKGEVRSTPDQLLSESVEEEPTQNAPRLEPDMQVYVESLTRTFKK
jgi:AcrR family transcriptional regulator